MDDSKNSAPSARKSTGKTEDAFSPAEALEILTKALDVCRQAGLPVYLTPIYEGGEENTGIILRKTRLEGKRLKYTGSPPPEAPENTGSPPEYTGIPGAE